MLHRITISFKELWEGGKATSAEPEDQWRDVSAVRHFYSVLSTDCHSAGTSVKQTEHLGIHCLEESKSSSSKTTGSCCDWQFSAAKLGESRRLNHSVFLPLTVMSETSAQICKWLHVSPLLQGRQVSLLANVKNVLNSPTFMLPSFLNATLPVNGT